jgi:hypothetical protein
MNRAMRLTKVTAWASLVGYVIVVSGLPLPLGGPATGVGAGGRVDPLAAARLGGKDRSTPFPCMDKPCGCGTAEQCFTNCCCNTPAETLAWARAHDIDPAVLSSLESRATAARRAAKPAPCCATKESSQALCCAAASTNEQAAADLPEVCAEYRSLAAEPARQTIAVDEQARPENIPSETPPSRTIVLRAMLACGGIAAGFAAATICLPADAPPRFEPDIAPGDRLSLADEVGISTGRAPEAPPPRS